MSTTTTTPKPQQRGETKLVSVEDAVTTKQAAGIRTWATEVGYQTEPSNLLRGRHGVTHFVLDEPPKPTSDEPRKLLVCAHGLGTNLHVYNGFVEPLLKEGYTVLRYEYFGFGWSVPDDVYHTYGPRMLADQIEDLLDHVCTSAEEKVAAFIGHSTGGCAAISATHFLDRPINNLCLVSPAFWVNKPFVGRVADRIPTFFGWLGKRGLLDGALRDALIVNNDSAFGKDDKGNYRYPEAHKKGHDALKSLFTNHPFACTTVLALGNNVLRGDIVGTYIEKMKVLSNRETDPVRVGLIVGELDTVVPFDQAQQGSANLSPNITFHGVKDMAHDSLYENSAVMVAACIEFLNASK
eukprot:m.127196 g.127196  ORF g.127196 m.127196 type:complete len:352 (-) comp29255_c1_seq1:188-1243(-)